ncbi:hypothetical protein PENSPDRAFT_452981 [Peniophora sp. CONT]|nr:hypothetical protein PENSPDRAFT_452981 [Peniophora sp. CONT]
MASNVFLRDARLLYSFTLIQTSSQEQQHPLPRQSRRVVFHIPWKASLNVTKASHRRRNTDIMSGDGRVDQPFGADWEDWSRQPIIKYNSKTGSLYGEGTSSDLSVYFRSRQGIYFAELHSITLQARKGGYHDLKEIFTFCAPNLRVLILKQYLLRVDCNGLKTLKVDLSGCTLPSEAHPCAMDRELFSQVHDSVDTLEEVSLLSCFDPHGWESFTRRNPPYLAHLRKLDIDHDANNINVFRRCFSFPAHEVQPSRNRLARH